ncbi:hypothetical protein ACM6XL_004162 [Vibrio vulnificus]|nr:hypothetical protein [Vibrio vulnificus]PNG68636.1 hypothetical protein TI06_21810 [Vibrio vulnificus]
MFNQVNSVVYDFLCTIGLLVSRLSASWLRLAPFSGHLFFGTGNSENCLIQLSSKREVRAVGAISNLKTGFGA